MAQTRQPKPELVPFATWLNGAMRARRMSGNDLARRLASSGSGVSEYLHAYRRPRFETLRRLAAIFGTTAEELEAMLPPEAIAAPHRRVGSADVERARGLLRAEGYARIWPYEVETDDLMDRSPPIVPGMVVWIDPTVRAPEAGRVVAVQVGGSVMIRSLGADGTLRSAVAPPIPLADAEILGTGRLAQVPI